MRDHSFAGLSRLCGIILFLLAQNDIAAACSMWNLSDTMSFDQGNNIAVGVKFSRRGDNLGGVATQYFVPAGQGLLEKLGMVGRDPTSLNGKVDGVVNGGNLDFKVAWDNGSIGMYKVHIDDHGRITGDTYDFHKPSSRAAIVGFDRVRCNDLAMPVIPAGQAPAADKPVHRLGKIDSSASTSPPQPPQARASQPDKVAMIAGQCASGFVWRNAGPRDHVCVPPASRDRASQENGAAASRWVNAAKTCIPGMVWREAFAGDQVCVPPSVRDTVREENRLASSRVAQ